MQMLSPSPKYFRSFNFQICTRWKSHETRASNVFSRSVRTMSSSTPQQQSKYWWESDSSSDRLSPPLHSKRIHILGIGPIGLLVAHSIISLPEDQRPPVTLLIHRPQLWEDFKSRDQAIRLVRNADGVEDVKAGFDVEVLSRTSDDEGLSATWEHVSRQNSSLEEGHEIISLIVMAKAAATVSALQSVRHRLSPASTILFIQNGMGQIDEVDSQVFPDPSSRPNYMQGIISHGLWMREPFTPIHAGIGSLSVGVQPRSSTTSTTATPQEAENSLWTPASRHLLNILLSASILHTVPLPSPQFLSTQLTKLAVNCVNNTVTPLLDIRNGHQLPNPAISSTVYPLLVGEISSIIRSLPEVKALPDTSPFEPKNLEDSIRKIIYMARKNSSSTREDVNNGRETELKYINGYLIRRGAELGVETKLMQLILALVEARGLEVKGLVSVE